MINDKLKYEEIYKEVWECRNFELSHLWQRSVFLAVFLLAIAGGYGKVICSMFFPSEQIIVVCNHGAEISNDVETSSIKSNQHLLAYALCWLGIVFSLLWVMMAKGSKYWYERYEGAICWFVDGEFTEFLDKTTPYHGNTPKLDSSRTNENVFSTLAGHFSVSRINVMIGIVALIAWSFLNMVHFGLALKNNQIFEILGLQCALFAIVQYLILGAIILSFLRAMCTGGK